MKSGVGAFLLVYFFLRVFFLAYFFVRQYLCVIAIKKSIIILCGVALFKL
jgi:hypothetical protein